MKPRRILSLVLHGLGCVAGLVLIIYGFVGWEHSGFFIGSRLTHSGLIDGRGQERGVVFMGVILFAYCCFALVSTTRYTRPDEGRDDGTPTI